MEFPSHHNFIQKKLLLMAITAEYHGFMVLLVSVSNKLIPFCTFIPHSLEEIGDHFVRNHDNITMKEIPLLQKFAKMIYMKFYNFVGLKSF